MAPNDPNLVQISLSAIAKMVKFDLSKPGTETIGLLIGNEENGVVYINDVRLGDQTGNAVHVEVSEAELTQAAIEISEREDGQVIVGWIHTHPGLSAFLSSTDIRTQSLYQSFMPNSVAIVIDPLQYGKSLKLSELDIKVFRVRDNKAVQLQYIFTNTVEFGLNTFITGDNQVEVHPAKPVPKTYQVKVPTKEKIRNMKAYLQANMENMANDDVQAINAWLELVEAMSNGEIKEVPVEVDAMMNRLDGSLGTIEDELIGLREDIRYGQSLRTLFAIIFGVILEFAAFWMFLM